MMEWTKKAGDFCAAGEVLSVIETDKVSTEVKAPENGVLQEIVAQADETVAVGQVLCVFKPGGEAPTASAAAPTPSAAAAAAAPAAAAPAPTPAPAAAKPAAAAPPSSGQTSAWIERTPGKFAALPLQVPTPPKGSKKITPFWEVPWRNHWYGA